MSPRKKTPKVVGGSRGGLRPSLRAARAANKSRARAAGKSRKQRYRVIVRLKRDGLTYTQIAHRLELAPSTVRDIASDPSRQGAKRRQKNLRRRKVRAKARGRTKMYARTPQHRAIIGAYAHRAATGEWPNQTRRRGR